MKNIYKYNSWTIYQHTRAKQKHQVNTWLEQNLIICKKHEGIILDILYSEFCDKHNIIKEKLTKKTFAKYLCLYLKEKNIYYYIKTIVIKKKPKRKYFGVTLSILT